MVYIGISYSVDFIWDFPIVIGKPIHFGDSWLDPPVLLPSPYHNPRLDLFQIFYTLLTSLNVRISRGLEEFHSLNLAKSALVTRIRKDDWSRAGPGDFQGAFTAKSCFPNLPNRCAQEFAGLALQGRVVRVTCCLPSHCPCPRRQDPRGAGSSRSAPTR